MTPPLQPTPAPDQGLMLRRWIAMLLRLSIGLGLLNSGLSSYLGAGKGGLFQNGTGFSLDPVMAALPYLSIAIGLAMILGFLTTVNAIASGFLTMVPAVLVTIQVITNAMSGAGPMNNQPWGNNPFMALIMMNTTPILLAQVLLIWLSPLENHPISVDTLIFGRRDVEIASDEPKVMKPSEGEPLVD